MLVFNVVVALFGAYMIWSALQMKKSGRINSMVLAQEELKKVKDTKGFIEFLYWREMRKREKSFYIYNMSYIKNSCHGNRPEPVISGVFPVATVFLF